MRLENALQGEKRKMRRRDFVRALGLGAAALARPGFLAAEVKHSATRITTSVKPNILLIMADDMGYSDTGCYGGEIDTPNLDALAANGVRFAQHYSTGRCWPSRSCILTGYYAQNIRRDRMQGIGMGSRPTWAPLAPELLKPYGYHSYHSGKWHIDGKPRNNGFERSWGSESNGCDWDRFFASRPWQEDGIKAPVKPGEEYYSTIAVADHAVQCLKLHKQKHDGQPFFQFVAFYSPHFPLHALQKDIDKYRNAYNEGWDVIRDRRWKRMKKMGLVDCELSARHEDIKPPWNLNGAGLKQRIGPGEVPYAVAWDSLDADEKKLQATKMAIHAAMIHRMDAEIGRLVKQLKEMGAYENTLILFVSDNGASAEQIIRGDKHDKAAPLGSAKSYLCLGPGWATAANTPFRLHKHWNHEGGISSPFVAHWPKGISAKGEIRHDTTHFVDIIPTALAAAGGQPPETHKGFNVPAKPGVSLLPVFAKDGTLGERTLWWSHEGNRAIRKGDWKLTMRIGNKQTWELYNLAEDRSETKDLAAKHPEKVQQLAKEWESVAQSFRDDLKGSGSGKSLPRRKRGKKK